MLPILSRFSGLKDQFTKLGLTGECLDGIMFDFGVSSMQVRQWTAMSVFFTARSLIAQREASHFWSMGHWI